MLARGCVLEGELEIATLLWLDEVGDTCPHWERLPGVLVRDPIDHLEGRISLERFCDAVAEPAAPVRVVEVEDGQGDAVVRGQVARLAARRLRKNATLSPSTPTQIVTE